MSQPVDLANSNISPLTLSPSSPSSATSSSFSHLSLTETDEYEYDHCRTHPFDEEEIDNSSVDSCTDPLCCPLPASPLPPKLSAEKPYSPVVTTIPESSFHPLVIVGAGPHSLALAARLSEPRPAALYTDLEHARLSWLQREQQDQVRQRKKQAKKTVKGHWAVRKLIKPEKIVLARGADLTRRWDHEGEVEKQDRTDRRMIKVFDSTSDQWLGRWTNYFEGLRIKTLRSPMLFHPSPADVDALVAYTKRTGREDELVEIDGVVGKELSKHAKKKKRSRAAKVNGTVPINERDRQDYFRPSSRLFRSFISEDLISRYSLSDLVAQSTVTRLTYSTTLQIEGDSEVFEGFLIESRDPAGATTLTAARAVAVAAGPSNRPNIPQVIKNALPTVTSLPSSERCNPSPWNESEIRGENWCHSSAFALKGFSPVNTSSLLGQKITRGAETTALVIGGGLTSVQIIDSLLSQGVSKVYLICRSHVKIKHFDFPLSWVSKYNNLEKASFWNCQTHQERLEMIQAARDGGSVNPEFYKLLNRYIKLGKVELKTLSQVKEIHFEEAGRRGWSIQGETRSTGRCDPILPAEPTKWQLEGIDYLVCSTGSRIQIDEALPFLLDIQQQFPVEKVGGLPCLTEDLQWNKRLPLFLMGAFSMLQLGPDALNLSGCRTGAERVAHRLGEMGIFETFSRGRLDQAELKTTNGHNTREYVTKGENLGTRLQEKQYRSGGEGNFFRGLSVGIEA